MKIKMWLSAVFMTCLVSCGGKNSGNDSPSQQPTPVASRSAVSVRCGGGTLYQCLVTWSDGSTTGALGVTGSSAPVVSSTSFLNLGHEICVNVHSDGRLDSRYC